MLGRLLSRSARRESSRSTLPSTRQSSANPTKSICVPMISPVRSLSTVDFDMGYVGWIVPMKIRRKGYDTLRNPPCATRRGAPSDGLPTALGAGSSAIFWARKSALLRRPIHGRVGRNRLRPSADSSLLAAQEAADVVQVERPDQAGHAYAIDEIDRRKRSRIDGRQWCECRDGDHDDASYEARTERPDRRDAGQEIGR